MIYGHTLIWDSLAVPTKAAGMLHLFEETRLTSFASQACWGSVGAITGAWCGSQGTPLVMSGSSERFLSSWVSVRPAMAEGLGFEGVGAGADATAGADTMFPAGVLIPPADMLKKKSFFLSLSWSHFPPAVFSTKLSPPCL